MTFGKTCPISSLWPPLIFPYNTIKKSGYDTIRKLVLSEANASVVKITRLVNEIHA